MEQDEPTWAPVTSDLVPLARLDDPVVTLVVPTRGQADAPLLRPRVWDGWRAELASRGAPSAALTAATEVVSGPGGPQTRGLAVIASDHGVEHLETWDDPPQHETVVWGPLPVLIPIVRRRQRLVPGIVVHLGSSTAHVAALTAAPPTLRLSMRAPGPTVRAESWARFRTLHLDDRSAVRRSHLVAAEIALLARATDAQFIVIGGRSGDVVAVSGALDGDLRPLIHAVVLDDRASGLAGDVVRRRRALSDEFDRMARRRVSSVCEARRGVQGVAAAAPAVSDGRVEWIAVAEECTGSELCFTDLSDGVISASGGSDELHHAAAGDVLVAAAVARGIPLWVLPAGADDVSLDGVAAAIADPLVESGSFSPN